MLYSRVSDVKTLVLPQSDPREFASAPRFDGAVRIFHLHWTDPVLRNATNEADAHWRAGQFIDGLDFLRARGGRVVWTVHNILPHECRFPVIEADLCQQIADRADAVHVMCAGTAEFVAPWYELPADRVHVIPHSSFVGIYPNAVDQEEARSTLNLPSAATVLLFIGSIRPYKGLDRLLDAFTEVYRARAETWLVVAGKPFKFKGRHALKARCARHPNVRTSFGAIEEQDMQLYLNACDVVVLPYRSILNSSVAMLAFSFQRPVVAPRAGCLEELVEADFGLTFDPSGSDLASVLLRSRELKADRYRRAAFKKALEHPPAEMSKRFTDLLASLHDLRDS